MRIVDMQTFVTLAQHRHFGRTASALNTTQPAISTRLAALERELGATLMHRSGREVGLTAEGEKVLRAFQRILSSMDTLRYAISDENAPPEVVRIGAIDSVCSTWLPLLVESLRQTMPGLKIELTVEGTKLLAQGLKAGEYDIIFAVDPAIDDSFRSFQSCVLQMVWAGSPKIINPDRVYDVDDLSRLPIITFPRDTPPYRMIAPYFQDEQVLASKLISSNSLYAIINLVIEGFGVAALPAVTIKRELKLGLLHQLKVAKHFPAMPIIATYQTSANSELMHSVVEQARSSAAHYCATVDPSTAWID